MAHLECLELKEVKQRKGKEGKGRGRIGPYRRGSNGAG